MQLGRKGSALLTYLEGANKIIIGRCDPATDVA